MSIIAFNDSFQLKTGCVCKPDSAPITFVLVRRFQLEYQFSTDTPVENESLSLLSYTFLHFCRTTLFVWYIGENIVCTVCLK